MTFRHITLLCCGVLMVACTPTNVPPANSSPTLPPAPTLPSAFSAPVDVAGPALIAAERAASIERDRARLRQLWLAEARIVDGRGTAATEDDYIWQGLPAILDRYELAVFPSPPPPLDNPTLPNASIQTDIPADNTHADNTIEEAATVEHGGDRWRLVRREGRWWLAELVYSTPD